MSGVAADESTEFDTDGRIAIIGMAGRFPGAADLSTFWSNLRNGVESIRELSEAELLAAGASIDDITDPSYVRRAAVLDDIDQFDAAFFGMSPRDAAVFDPQHRIFLECAWEAFEHAGYVGQRIGGSVGVFASSGWSEYMFKHVLANAQMKSSVGEWLIRHTGNEANFLATRVAYELDLRGPSLTVQTACSSALVGVHLACQSLLSGECDVALAGGVSIAPGPALGYLYKQGEILSPDGHCRSFDAASAGTVWSSASGCVLLKPLAAAIDDGDNILAVIRGSAINNDGRDKVGFLAPSVGGQARVVTEALTIAGVDARDVSYVEAHGTATLIGDPIEVAGLTEAFRQMTTDRQFCAIGSLKTNIGHAAEAAGIGGLIKTVLALQHREIPANLHHESPNPQCDFENSPFYVNDRLRPWDVAAGATRIAGVTALGAGGTNAHVIIEERPQTSQSPPSEDCQLIAVSARTPASLGRATVALVEHLRAHPELDLADVSYTLLEGRKPFKLRRAVVASSPEAAATALESSMSGGVPSGASALSTPSVVFMMPGAGSQYAGMGRGLYQQEPVFRKAIDECCRIVNPLIGFDLRSLLYPSEDASAATAALDRPSLGLPALISTELAMARLLASRGIEPSAMIGHSAGEHAAACLAGVISLDDALRLVALRGRLFETLLPGAMLSVSMPEQDVRDRLPEGLGIAAVNSWQMCVVSGPVDLVEQLEELLVSDAIDCARIHIDVAAHSAMLDPILAEFAAFCRTIRFSPPSIPYVSNLTGTWMTDQDAVSPTYWVEQMRQTVRFSEGISTILERDNRMLLEVGPGRTLSSFARAPHSSAVVGIVPTLRHPNDSASDVAVALGAVGRCWAAGVDVDVTALHGDRSRRRTPLPTYPFDRQRYWVDADPVSSHEAPSAAPMRKRHDITQWFYTPSWRRSVIPGAAIAQLPYNASDEPGGAVPDNVDRSAAVIPLVTTMLVTGDGSPLAKQLEERLRREQRVITVAFGERFRQVAAGRYELTPSRSTDWVALVEALRADGTLPDNIVHMTAIGPSRGRRLFGMKVDPVAAFAQTVERDHAGLIFLAAALSGLSRPMHLMVLTSGVHAVANEASLHPERSLLHGACRVIPRELTHVTSVAVDIDAADTQLAMNTQVDVLRRELAIVAADDVVVYRRGERWVRTFEPIPLPAADQVPWKPGGLYVITGGLGGIGMAIAERIAASAPAARLVLIGRTPLPADADWPGLLRSPTTPSELRSKLEAIGRMRTLGAHVIIESADVTDAATMANVIGRVRQEFGPITGVVHAAGILRDALIALRTPLAMSAVVDVKAKGVLILDSLLAKNPPELIVLCSSVSALIGLPGQIDYSSANAFLDAYACKTNLEGASHVVSINWSAWQDVGMAVAAAQSMRDRGERPPSGHPAFDPVNLFDDIVRDTDAVRLSAKYSRARRWLLSEHVVRGGDALIPGTGYLELMRNAVSKIVPHGEGGATLMEIIDVFFLAPFAVAREEVRTLTVKVDEADGSVSVFSDSEDAPHATARFAFVDPPPAPRTDVAEIKRRCVERTDTFDGFDDQAFMDFGPRWGNLCSIDFGHAEAVITSVMPGEFAHELEYLWLHPGMLDILTGGAQALIPGFNPATTFYVPFSYRRVLVRGPLPSTAFSHVRIRPSAVADVAVFDITITDAAGTEAVCVEGFTMRRVSSGSMLAERRSPVEGSTEIRATESAIDAALREGILPSEGVEALDRVLAAHLSSQVVVCSIDLHQWIAQVDEEMGSAANGEIAAERGLQFERPEITAPFVAPATAIEADLAALWRELLGVERVGRHDDFFELGGQSLIAVRLFNSIRKKYSIDLPLATLFEAPTISECAIVVASRGVSDSILDRPGGEAVTAGSVDDDASTAVASATASDRSFRSLVTIQRGAERIPFFCVHGAGGNVLNFRDLSVAMGRTQPFYGLQARGIDGLLTPHHSIEEMAIAYLEEVRVVQPHGPYVLGGYSGGGLVAYEMARQLTAVGESVALVVLIDTFPPDIPVLRTTFIERFGRVRNEGRRYLSEIVMRRIDARAHRRGLARIDACLADGSVIPPELREGYMERNFAVVKERYTLQRWTGRVTLLRAEVLAFAYRGLGTGYGWDTVVDGDFQVVEVPGNHDTLVLEPNATKIVQVLRDTIDNVSAMQLGVQAIR